MDHFKCREKVCALCFCMKGKKASFKITESQELALRKCIPDYDSSKLEYPIGLCDSCRVVLNSQKGKKPQKMDYQDYEPAAIAMTRLNLVKRAKFQKCFFWCFFIRNNLSRVDLIIKVVLEFLSDP